MRNLLIFIILIVSPALALAQIYDAEARARLVKDQIGTIYGSNKKQAEVILQDLREFEGKIIGVYGDHFIIHPKGKRELKWTVVSIGTNPNRRPPGVYIRYSDVLQVEGKNAAISFVPDPAASPYASWYAVGTIGRGEFVQVHRTSGEKIHGVFYRSAPDSLSLMKGNREVVIPASEIAKVYRVKGDIGSLTSKIVTGGVRGAEISEDWLPLLDPRRLADPAVLMVGAAAGAAIYLLPIRKPSRVLIVSR